MKIDFRNAFFDRLFFHAKKNKNIIILRADISAHSFAQFKKKIPSQLINVGITEQSMISLAAGLAMNKKKVFVFSMIPFLTMRSLEHIKIDICSHNLPVTLVGLGSGFSYDTDGHSAQATFDIGIMKNLPEMQIFNTSDSISTKNVCDELINIKSPAYIRLDKSQVSNIYPGSKKFTKGYNIIGDGKDIALITTGIMVSKCLELIKNKKLTNYKNKISVIDIHRLKPIQKNILNILHKFKKIIVIDENTFTGGLSSLFAEFSFMNNFQAQTHFIHINNKQNIFKYGNRQWLHKLYKIDNPSLIKKILKVVKN